MTWLSMVGTVLYYLSRPITTTFNWILVILAPIIHLVHYITWACLLPLKLVTKFETIYIFLGVAAIVGLATGSILHLSSTILASLFNLNTVPEETGRTAASVRASRENKRLETAWQRSTMKTGDAGLHDEAMAEGYPKWPGSDVSYRKEDQGLLAQTILEEDDSDDLI